MQLSIATSAGSPARTQFARQLALALAVAGTLALLGLGSFLFVRRLAGAFAHPLPSLAILAAACVLPAFCLPLHGLWQQLLPARGRRFVVAVVIAFAFLLVASAITLPGSPPVPLGTFWAIMVFSEGLALLVAWRGWPQRGSLRGYRSAPAATAQRSETLALPPSELLEDESGEAGLPAGATQRMIRSRDAAGREAIYGALREYFAAGQRTANLHVAFCPPLGGVPELSIEQIAGPEVAVKIGELQPYGARLDLRLKRASGEPVEVLLEFAVVEPAASAAR